MNKFVFGLMVFTFFLLPLPALATSLNLVAPENSSLAVSSEINNFFLKIDEDTIGSWQGRSAIATSPLLNSAPTPAELLASAVGQTVSAPETAPASYHYNVQEVYNFVRALSQKVNRPPQEPQLTINGNRATAFTPPQPGLELDALQTTLHILEALENNQTAAPLAVASVESQTQLAETNGLGINELLSSGVSNFAGSPANRRHNIQVGVQKMTGIILAPGEEFSFNKFLGPVVAEAGFLPELVIKREGTIPELGGGLCQVSTTAFRAAMLAGLPITQRKNHAYAVQYYSPQGTDATIYPGVVDLKFVNDTLGHLLIWPHFTGSNILVFDFYGTSDGRQVVLSDPVQFDRKPDGSLKASWQRQVTKNGQTATDIFKSTYQPPALYHKQEQFVTGTSSPTTFRPTLKPAIN